MARTESERAQEWAAAEGPVLERSDLSGAAQEPAADYQAEGWGGWYSEPLVQNNRRPILDEIEVADEDDRLAPVTREIPEQGDLPPRDANPVTRDFRREPS
jgi:hypothetical protein